MQKMMCLTIKLGAQNQIIITSNVIFYKKTQSRYFSDYFCTQSTKRQTKRMKPSESHGANKSNSEKSQAEFNALVLRHKAMIWHICSDYSLGRAWNIEDCIQEVMVSL